jgi:hypothetical protein
MAYPEYLVKRTIELSPGRSAGEILRVLGREFPNDYLPDERTIRRWLKDKPTAFASNEQKTPTSVLGNWEEHNAKLAGVADRLLANDLKRVMKWVEPPSDIEYLLWDGSETHVLERLTEDDLSGQFEQNIGLAYQEYTEWFFKECFLPHLYAEWPEELKNKGFYIVAEEQPYLLIETLRLLAERKTFKGTCPVCKDHDTRIGES